MPSIPSVLHSLAQRTIGHAQGLLVALSRGSLPPFCCVAAVVERDGQLLLLRRSDGQGLCLPGGYVKTGEEPRDAMVREAREETGFTVRIDRLLGVLPDSTSRIKSVNVVFACSVVEGSLSASHEGEPLWVDPSSCEEPMLAVSRLTLARFGYL